MLHSSSRSNSPSMQATLIGCVALLIWACAALCSVELKAVPTFLLVALVCGWGYLTSSLVNRSSGNTVSFRTIPIHILCIGWALLFATQAGYLAAFKYAPPVQVDLIYYLWPIIVIVALALSLGKKGAKRNLFGALLGFFGVYFVISNDHNIQPIQVEHIAGYALALLAALAWGGYTVYAHRSSKAPIGLMGLCCAPTALLALILHMFYEPAYSPSLREWFFATLMGVSILGFSLLLWDHGIKKGHVSLLSLLSYFNPILSIGVLVVCGQATHSNHLWLGTTLVATGALVSRPSFGHESGH